MSSDMDFIVEPLKVEEVDDFYEVQQAAFLPPEADAFMPMIWPRGLTPDLKVRLRTRLLASTNNDPGSICFVAKDAKTRKIVGILRWETNLEPPQSKAEIDARWEKALKSMTDFPPVEGENRELALAFFETSFFTSKGLLGNQPHMELALLATHPDYHRKGVGSLLIRLGLQKADELKLPVYVNSARSGKLLYERHGFQLVKDFEFDARDYGGRSEGKHWCMIRPART